MSVPGCMANPDGRAAEFANYGAPALYNHRRIPNFGHKPITMVFESNKYSVGTKDVMPLTAYSISAQKEEDVVQVLRRLSLRFGTYITTVEAVPETWRAFLRQDLECPCCFVTGAELVKEAFSKANKAAVRQAYFRFSNPKHRDYCDFDSSETAMTVPENLIAFSDSSSPITEAVRVLVGTGIELGIFSQKSIRDMREWFFNKKSQSMFVVTLDPRFPKWMHSLYREKFHQERLESIERTAEVVADPKFIWRAAVANAQLLRHPEYRAFSDAFDKKRNPFFLEYYRIGTLARRSQGRPVFDPSSLEEEYRKTCQLAKFIATNHEPLRFSTSNKGITVSSVLALSALLLFVRDWNQDLARADFSKIADTAGSSNQDLGNVMGLNPFHEFRAWQALKAVQEFDIHVPEYIDLKAERAAIEQELRAKFGAPPIVVK